MRECIQINTVIYKRKITLYIYSGKFQFTFSNVPRATVCLISNTREKHTHLMISFRIRYDMRMEKTVKADVELIETLGTCALVGK